MHDRIDLSDADASEFTGWLALPEGTYKMMVSAGAYKSNKQGNGMNVELEVQCLEPEHKTAKWREWLSVKNPNETAQRIARGKLKQLQIALGFANPNDFDGNAAKFVGRPFVAVVTVEPAKAGYGDANGMQNRIKAFRPANGNGVTQVDAQTAESRATAKRQNTEDLDEIPF